MGFSRGITRLYEMPWLKTNTVFGKGNKKIFILNGNQKWDIKRKSKETERDRQITKDCLVASL